MVTYHSFSDYIRIRDGDLQFRPISGEIEQRWRLIAIGLGSGLVLGL